MMRKHYLVIGQLEKISGDIIDNYRPLIRDMIRGKSGIYALYDNNKLYYVGLATNLMKRLNDHLKDRHKGNWNYFSVYLTRKDEHMKELESLFLRILKPPGNTVKGGFTNSDNLWPKLKKSIRNEQKIELARLKVPSKLKTSRQARATNSAVKKAKGSQALADFVSQRMKLRAVYKGYEYTAILRKNGTISMNGYVYNSPTAAARDIVGRNVSGLGFWKYRDDSGEWVKLRNLRK